MSFQAEPITVTTKNSLTLDSMIRVSGCFVIWRSSEVVNAGSMCLENRFGLQFSRPATARRVGSDRIVLSEGFAVDSGAASVGCVGDAARIRKFTIVGQTRSHASTRLSQLLDVRLAFPLSFLQSLQCY
jgi:hypothetical protein